MADSGGSLNLAMTLLLAVSLSGCVHAQAVGCALSYFLPGGAGVPVAVACALSEVEEDDEDEDEDEPVNE